ncbi:hypothetical protein SMICM17S_00328 [Streptomyces microflavus]
MSRWVTTIARGIPTSAHSSHTARVVAATDSAAWAAETTKRAASAARRPARSSPTKSAYPGASSRLTLRPSHATGTRERWTERRRRRSISVVVGDGRPVLDPARPVHGPRRQGQGLDQGGLARSAVADQHHVPYVGGVAGRRYSSGGPGVCVRLLAHGVPPGGWRGAGTGEEPTARWGSGGHGHGEGRRGGPGDARGPSSLAPRRGRVHMSGAAAASRDTLRRVPVRWRAPVVTTMGQPVAEGAARPTEPSGKPC